MPGPPRGFEPLTPSEPGVETQGAQAIQAGQAAPPGFMPVEPEGPSLGARITGRFLGTDVEDPMPFIRLGTTIAGAAAGGVKGAAVGAGAGSIFGPPGTVIGGGAGLLIGGGLGAVGGAVLPEATLEAGEALGLLEAGTREREGLSPEELRTLAEGEALLEIATAGGFSVLRLGGRATGKLVTGARKELAEKAARLGIDMMPVQVGDRIIGRGFVAVFGRFPLLGGGVIRRRGEKAEKQVREFTAGLVERTGPVTDAADLGKQIFGNAKILVKETNRHFGKKYKDIFARAEASGIRVVPKETVAKADEIIQKLSAKTPVTLAGKTIPGPALQKVKDFIETTVQPMRAKIPGTTAFEFPKTPLGEAIDPRVQPTRVERSGGTAFRNQSFEEMDGLISKIDQEIASLEPGQKRFALALLLQLRQAAKADTVANLRGVNAAEIGRAMRELDTEFSHTMSQLFETATAKRFTSVEKRGLRAIEFDRTTRMPVDQIARVVVDLNSPQAVDELSRIILPDTLRRVAAHTIDDAMQMAAKSDGLTQQLDINVFAKRLGLDGTNEARRRTIKTLLEKSGSDVTLRDLEDIVAAGQALAGFDIPNVSSFIARRGAIGGIESIINGVVPGLALAGGASTVGAFSGSSFVGAVMFVGGSHLFARIVSNPNSARALHKVFDKEATAIVRRTAFIEALRGGMEEMRDAGEISGDTFFKLVDVLGQLVNAMDDQIKSLAE